MLFSFLEKSSLDIGRNMITYSRSFLASYVCEGNCKVQCPIWTFLKMFAGLLSVLTAVALQPNRPTCLL